jgi:hypothetical protein
MTPEMIKIQNFGQEKSQHFAVALSQNREMIFKISVEN